MMTRKPIILVTMVAAVLALGACDKKPADGAGVAQGRAPEGTISDELPDLDLLPNDAPLADPADVPPGPPLPGVPGLPGDAAAEAAPSAPTATQPAPAEPIVEGSIAQ